jgi:hypothetical protein
MADMTLSSESPTNTLCKSCGLCCTGHLFVWTKLRSAELDSIQGLGLKVFREPSQRGFSQPCPLWNGKCTVYDSPHYPRFCKTYKCKLLNELIAETVELSEALDTVESAKTMIGELELLLSVMPGENFRERLAAYLGGEDTDPTVRERAENLLAVYKKDFGINDIN